MNLLPEKILKPATIIPKNLYVERTADKQLRSVVKNMGRPGYVLVARQMGKTNLLLNAKNELGQDGDIFIYIDLSNYFPSLQQFFRNIIDVAIDTHPDTFPELEEKLHLSREKIHNRPAHKEHEQELRMLLKSMPGKLVICLDEIDALAKADYSDSVFSLIRSTYFASRSNYQEFNRLTYILSGVAEANDIIKNKDISPFNIGEKIFLDDFTYVEFRVFIEKAQLKLDEATIERVYYWTSGNPRMCWDVCSGLEDVILNDEILSTQTVDSVVQKLYLTSYNLAPVDHIRQQVTEDKDIRTAIMNIHLNKSASVTDAQRTKLYLAGITGSDFANRDVKIKNRIIEQSLSEAWITSLDESNISVLEAADRKYAARDFLGALKLYEDYFSEQPESRDSMVFYKLGDCSFMVGSYENSLNYFSKAMVKRTEWTALYYRKNLYQAIALHRIGKNSESINAFDTIINSLFEDEKPTVYYEALINICAPFFEDFELYGQRIIEYCKIVIESEDFIRQLEGISDNGNSLMFAAHQYISEAYLKFEKTEAAQEHLTASMQYANSSGKLAVISQLLAQADTATVIDLLATAQPLLSQTGVEFSHNILKSENNFSPSDYASLITAAFMAGGDHQANAFLDPLLQGKFGQDAALVVLSIAAQDAVIKKYEKYATWLYFHLLERPEKDLNSENRKQIYIYLLKVSPDSSMQRIENRFIKDLVSQPPEIFGDKDARIIFDLVKWNVEKEHFFRAERLFEVVSKIRSALYQVDKNKLDLMKELFLPIDYLELALLSKSGEAAALHFRASSIQVQLDSVTNLSPFFGQQFLDRIRQDVGALLTQFEKSSNKELLKKYGRNQRVRVQFLNGDIREGKYKRFAEEIIAGKCTIVI